MAIHCRWRIGRRSLKVTWDQALSIYAWGRVFPGGPKTNYKCNGKTYEICNCGNARALPNFVCMPNAYAHGSLSDSAVLDHVRAIEEQRNHMAVLLDLSRRHNLDIVLD